MLKLQAAKLIVLRQHPEALAVETVAGVTIWIGNKSFVSGWASERGAWAAAAEKVATGSYA